jgi:[FeFe] hydrogenase H-cluster maturation GTPase HydF
MQTTPKSMRLQIGLFGRTNVGKSSFLNMIAGQDIAVTSEIPGTTTDIVEKSMELLPVGPVVFLDTAGIDDQSELSEARIKKTGSVFDRAEVFVIITEPQMWTGFEEQIVFEAKKRERPFLVVVNKIDKEEPSEGFLDTIRKHTQALFCCSSINNNVNRSGKVTEFKEILISCLPDKRIEEPSIIGDLLPPGGLAVLIVPIDLQAPKGRLILPQVQTIRDALDNDASALIVKEREYAHILSVIGKKPDLVVCDSQIVLKMIADTPPEIPCTTFSILFARFKADICELARGAAVIERLVTGDKVLIAEACSHHAAEDDIGRVKIPRWLRQYAGCDLQIDVCCGRDFPENLNDYKLIIHCGSCMFTRSETLGRMKKAAEAGIAVTNYGVAISFLQGVLEKVLSPFPAALDAYRRTMKLTIEK